MTKFDRNLYTQGSKITHALSRETATELQLLTKQGSAPVTLREIKCK